MSKQGDAGDHYLPFNLSTVSPFEGTAAALRALPTVQPRAPAGPQLLPANLPLDTPCDSETERLMLRMLVETAREGDWSLECEPREPLPKSADAPAWVQNLAVAVPFEISQISSRVHESLLSDARPAKRPRTSLAVSPTGTEGCTVETTGSCPTLDHDIEERVDDEDSRDEEIREAQAEARDESVKGFISVLEALVDRIDTFVERDVCDAFEAKLRSTSNPVYIHELLQTIQINAQLMNLTLVPEHVVCGVVEALVARVRASIAAVSHGHSRPASVEAVSNALLGTRCGCAVVKLLSAEGSPRSLLVQDTLDAVLEILRASCVRFVFPSSDPLYTVPRECSEVTGSAAADPKDPRKVNPEPDPQDALFGGGEPLSSAKRSRGRQNGTVGMKVKELLQACCLLFDSFADLLARERGLGQSFVSQLVSLAVACLGVDGVSMMQVSASKCVEALVSSYPEHDVDVLDGVRDELSRLPPNRRSLRTYHVRGSTSQVRVGSALLVKIANVVLSRGTTKVGADTSGRWDDLFEDRRDRCMRLAFRVVDEMLGRVVSGREPEHRTALQCLMIDLLELFALPEWAGAELLVQALTIRLVMLLKKGSEVSVYARSLAMDMLGSIAARLCALFGLSAMSGGDVAQAVDNASAYRKSSCVEHRVVIAAYVREESKADKSLVYVERAQTTLFMIDDADAEEEQLKASQGIMSEGVPSDRRDIPSARKAAAIAGLRAMYATLKDRKNSFDISRNEAVEASRIVSGRRLFARQLPRILGTISDGLLQPEPTLRAKAVKALAYVADYHPTLFENLPSLLSAVESSCIDVSKSVREASLDLLARSVLRPFASSGIGTRQDLSSQACPALRSGVFFEKLFPVLQQRLLDSAVSVRKRAITILDSVLRDCVGQLDSSASDTIDRRRYMEDVIVRVCCTLAGRLDDRETTVRTLVERALRFALFGFDPSSMVQARSRSADEASSRGYTFRLVALYAAVMKVPKPTSSQRNLLPLVLHEAILVKRRPFLGLIAAEMVEMLHSCEGRLVELGQSPSVRRNRDVSDARRADSDAVQLRRLACASALEGLTAVDPALAAPYCQALSPYVKGIVEVKRRSTADVMYIQRILGVLERSIPAAGRAFSSDELEDVIRDVEKLVCICPSPGVAPAAIKCFCALAQNSAVPEIGKLPEETARVFYSFLQDSRLELIRRLLPENSETIRNAKQALPRLGLLARYGELDAAFTEDVFLLLDALARGLIGEWLQCSGQSVARNLSQMRQVGMQSLPLRLSVLQALTHFLVRHRKFLPQGTEFFVACLRQTQGSDSCESVDYEAQLTVLSGFHDILLQEEHRNLVEAKKIGKEVNSALAGAKCDVVLAAEEDAEAGFLAACAQALVPELDRASRSGNADVRKAVVNSFGLLARQGLVLPATIVPALFGLLVDSCPTSREKALQVVGFLAERHPAMLSAAAAVGIRQAYVHIELACRGDGESPAEFWGQVLSSAVDRKTGYSLLSGALMLLPREQRKGILCGLIREFDPRAKLDKSPEVEPSVSRQGSLRKKMSSIRDASLVRACRAVREGNSAVCEGPLSQDEREANRAAVLGGRSPRDRSEAGAQDGNADVYDANGNVNAAAVPDLGSVGLPSDGHMDSEDLMQDHGDIDEGYDSDNDVAAVRSGNGPSILRSSGTVSSVRSLAFYAVTLATLDYAAGAGVGGSLTCGGGSAAADNKLRMAREDVTEITAVASRVISNSGQAVLQSIRHVLELDGDVDGYRAEISRSAIPLCLLLMVKRFLRCTRWFAAAPADEKDEEDEADGMAAVAKFDISGIPLLGDVSSCDIEHLGSRKSEISKLLQLFRELMRDDSIDEADAANGSRGSKKRVSRRRVGTGAPRGRTGRRSGYGSRRARRTAFSPDVNPAESG